MSRSFTFRLFASSIPLRHVPLISPAGTTTSPRRPGRIASTPPKRGGIVRCAVATRAAAADVILIFQGGTAAPGAGGNGDDRGTCE
jgi:hypothetical protein